MRILLTNDDGVHANGLKTLYAELKRDFEILVVAPLEERSTTGHTVTLNNPLRVRKIEENIFGCSGYPADCTLMGIGHFLKDVDIDLVISGINRGANLGQDIYYSGTVAAAREAVFHGIPGIAVSTAINPVSPQDKAHYQTAAKFIRTLLNNKAHQLLKKYLLVNVNVPNIPEEEIQGVEVTSMGIRKYSSEIDQRVDCRGREYFWIGGMYRGFSEWEGTDCLAIENKKISVTPLNIISGLADNTEEWVDAVNDDGKNAPKNGP